MKSTVEQLNTTRVKLTVEVPFTELKQDFDRAYKAIGQQVNVPGFRKGKVPARLIDARFGRGVVLEQVVNDIIPARYQEAVSQNSVKALGQPEIEVTKIEDNDHIEFTAEVDVRPEFEIPDFAAINVEVDSVEVSDEDVEAEIDNLRARFGTLKSVERAAQDEDFVSIDLSATIDGQPVEDATTEGLSHQVGSGELIDGLDEAIVGLSEGESKEFTSELVAGAQAGQPAQVTVTVKSVKERELPEKDDEFAQLASEFDTFAELAENLREQVKQRKGVDQGGNIRDKVLDALLEAASFEVPAGIVEAEAHGQIDQLLQQFGGDESIFETALQAQGTSREDFERDAHESAERSVRIQLLLDAVADVKDTQVSQEELTEHILFQAQRYGIEPAQFIQQIQSSGQLASLFSDVRRGKALAGVVLEATVKDSDGNIVDTEPLFGTPEEEGAAAAEGDADAEGAAAAEDSATGADAAEVDEDATESDTAAADEPDTAAEK